MSPLARPFDPANHRMRINSLVFGNLFRPMNRAKQGEVGLSQGIRKTILEDVGDRGVAAGLETRDQAMTRPAGPKRLQGSFDGGGVMAEIGEHHAVLPID